MCTNLLIKIMRQNEEEKRIEVRIFDKVNYALISIDKNRGKATLRFKQKSKKMKSPIMSLKQHCVYTFLVFCQTRVPELIFSMISDYGTSSPASALKILGQDDLFKVTLEKTKDNFEKQYQLILSK